MTSPTFAERRSFAERQCRVTVLTFDASFTTAEQPRIPVLMHLSLNRFRHVPQPSSFSLPIRGIRRIGLSCTIGRRASQGSERPLTNQTPPATRDRGTVFLIFNDKNSLVREIQRVRFAKSSPIRCVRLRRPPMRAPPHCDRDEIGLDRGATRRRKDLIDCKLQARAATPGDDGSIVEIHH